jgi:hypothetical protein
LVLALKNRYNMGTTKSSRVYRKVVLKKNKTTQSGEAPYISVLLLTGLPGSFHWVSMFILPLDEERGWYLKGVILTKINHFINQEKNKIDRIIWILKTKISR